MLIRYIWYINRAYCFCQVSSLRAFGNVHISALQFLRGHFCKRGFMVSARGSQGSMSGAMLSNDHSGLLHHSPEVRSHYCLIWKESFYILVWWIILVQTGRNLRSEALLYLLYIYVPLYPSFSAWEATMIAHSVKGRKLSHKEVNEGAHRHRAKLRMQKGD